MSERVEYFSFSVSEYQAVLSKQHAMTLGYLLGKEYITPEIYDKLIDTTVVAGIPNNKSYARRLLERLFHKDDSENTYHFYISEIQQTYQTDKPKNPPKLKKVIDNENI